MDVFSIGGESKPVKVWGPTASVQPKIHALGELVGDDWLVEGVQVGAKEIVDVRQCFNDVSYIYALGNDQSRCSLSVQFIVFVGTKDCKGKENMEAISNGIVQYKNRRISQAPTPGPIGIGGFSVMGWLIGIDIGSMDAGKGVCHGVATFIMQLEA